MTFLTHPAFRFCSYCGAEWKMVKHRDEWNYVACSFCFAAIPASNASLHSEEETDWISDEWHAQGKQTFLKRVYIETDDQVIKDKIAALILGAKG